jgi:LmbE family N-acetylglucosaminyl deacetylase
VNESALSAFLLRGTVLVMTVDRPRRVMGVFAHPDDAAFFCGATLAKFACMGSEVTVVVATSGDKGSSDPEMTAQRLVGIREAEERACNAVLGVHDVIFLRYPDGELTPTLGLRRDITRLLRHKRPDLVITLDPRTWFYGSAGINHPDHRAIGAATLEAIYPTARDRLNFPEMERDEGLQPHKVLTVYLAGANDPDVRVDVTETIELKIKALYEHKSQITDMEAMAQRVRQRAVDDASPNEFPRYVEQFKVIQLR